MQQRPVFTNIDAIELYVDDLDKGLAYYQQALGLHLLWRSDTTLGLGLENDITEVVLQTDRHEMNVDIKVPSVPEAVERVCAAGGTLLYPVFDIPIGRCAVVKDPFGNRYVILDMSKGKYTTDANGYVVGVDPALAE